MLSKCANPSCRTSFLYMRAGKLFRIEVEPTNGADNSHAVELKKPARRTEFFWLCRDCATKMTLGFEKGVGVQTRPLERGHAVAS